MSEIPQKSDVVKRLSYADEQGLGTNRASSTRTPARPIPKQDSNYDSTTPTSTAQDDTTAISNAQFSGDQVAAERLMSREERLAWRMKAANAAKPNSDTSLPGFVAGEVED